MNCEGEEMEGFYGEIVLSFLFVAIFYTYLGFYWLLVVIVKSFRIGNISGPLVKNTNRVLLTKRNETKRFIISEKVLTTFLKLNEKGS